MNLNNHVHHATELKLVRFEFITEALLEFVTHNNVVAQAVPFQ
ncbi:MAG: hypothetical protein Q8S84_07465 [bacterium]|nr:hypothetical protein [bacterium]